MKKLTMITALLLLSLSSFASEKSSHQTNFDNIRAGESCKDRG